MIPLTHKIDAHEIVTITYIHYTNRSSYLLFHLPYFIAPIADSTNFALTRGSFFFTQALFKLPKLLRVDLSQNCLNGTLSSIAGRLTQLEEVV